MKKIVIGIMLAMLAMTACEKKNKKAPINTTSDRGKRAAPYNQNNPYDPNNPSGSSSLSGQILGEDEQSFQDAIKGFLSASVDEQYVGEVSSGNGGYNQGTGAYFGGRVRIQTGNGFSARGGMPRTTVSRDSILAITVVDKYAIEQEQEGKSIPPMSVNLVQASGYVQGNEAHLQFWDEYGSVEMVGEFDETYFEGRISYSNDYMWDGSQPGEAGRLGYFRVRTCTFFECN